MRAAKPKPCEKPPTDSQYPTPRGVHLKSGTDIAEQGSAYGDAYERGRDHHADREDTHEIYWTACEKQYEADLERWETNEATRKAAIAAAKKLSE